METTAFNIKRLGKYIRYELSAYAPGAAKLLVGICAFQILIWIISIINDITGWHIFFVEEGKFINNPYFLCILAEVVAIFSPYIIYRDINNRKSGYAYAMLPASTLEKYISMLVISLVIVPATAFAGVFLIDTVLTLLSKIGIGGFSNFSFVEGIKNGLFSFNMLSNCIVSILYPVFFTTLFSKNKILYSIITVTVLVIIVGYFYAMFLSETINCMAQDAGVEITTETVKDIESLSIELGEANLSSLDKVADKYILTSRIINLIVMPVLLLTGTWFNIKRFKY